MTGSIVVANAPVSYGAFELTVGHDPNVPDGIKLLDEVAAAGYAGIDLGPVGYLGSGAVLAERLRDRGLGLAGAYLELPFTDRAALSRSMDELDAMLDTFDAVVPRVPGPPPRPTLAVAGTPARLAAPGIGGRDPRSAYDDASWAPFATGWNWSSPSAAAAATSPRSTTRPGRTLKVRPRSSRSSPERTCACAWIPGTSRSRAATP